jgi:DNA-binding CsgD family transcriptional regulator
MSFNEIAEFRELLSRISKERSGLINAGKRSLLWAIISQSDGCFVGYVELADQAGLKPDTVKTYLRDLTNLSIILKEQTYPRKGIRQCYRVSLTGLRGLVRVLPVTPIDQDIPLMGGTESVKGVTESLTGYHQSPTYREEREYKEERVNNSLPSFNLSRFEEFVLLPLPKDVRPLVTPGRNFELLLDELETLGALRDVPGALNRTTYDPSRNPGGLVIRLLNDLLTVTKSQVENERLRNEHDLRVAQEIEELARNASSDPSRFLEEARRNIAEKRRP